MALGDHQRVQNSLDYWGGLTKNHLDNLRTNLTRQNQGLENRFNVAADQSGRDYSDIMGRYGDLGSMYGQFMQNGPISYMPSNQNFGAYGGYEDFAKTGGFSGQDIQNIRARSNAPMKATYANAQADVDRRNRIAGGNLANYPAAKAKMSRELAYSLGDQSLNTEAMLAEAIRSGKLAGLGGMTGIDTSRMQEGLANASGNLQGQGMESNRQLSGLSGMGNVAQGMTSLYGATPGQASMYGNQMLNSSGQQLQTEQLQQQLMRAIIEGTLGMSNVPGNYQQILGNIGSTLNLAGQVGSTIGGFGGFGGGAGMPGLPGGTKGPF